MKGYQNEGGGEGVFSNLDERTLPKPRLNGNDDTVSGFNEFDRAADHVTLGRSKVAVLKDVIT